MEPKWAEENLQTIRTLMEHSAVYRRSLTPIMLLAGILGILAAGIGILFKVNSLQMFTTLWLGAAMVTVASAFLIARRQAITEQEKFWSPPTRRVAQALSLPLGVGFILSLMLIALSENDSELNLLVSVIWIMFYGLALHSTGFFMPRGIKYFGWLFVILDLAFIFSSYAINGLPKMLQESGAHWLMGFFFGVLHLAYGAYLYLTEKKNPVA